MNVRPIPQDDQCPETRMVNFSILHKILLPKINKMKADYHFQDMVKEYDDNFEIMIKYPNGSQEKAEAVRKERQLYITLSNYRHDKKYCLIDPNPDWRNRS